MDVLTCLRVEHIWAISTLVTAPLQKQDVADIMPMVVIIAQGNVIPDRRMKE
jgi:hypothetical protein